MNTTLDNKFLEIKGLKWLPWVGNNYLVQECNPRMLIVGESHYHDNSQQSKDNHEDTTFTRKIIKELAIDRHYWGTKIFPNLHKALFRNDRFNTTTFWNEVSFYNFIQRPMNTNKDRPINSDFYNGWLCFFEIIKILQPKTCLFIGTSAANHLVNLIEETGYTCTGVKWDEFISNAYAKSATITDSQNKSTKFIFIRHTSQMFSWNQWNKYLQKVITHELDYFETKINGRP